VCRIASTDDGNRQMVDILNAVLTAGLPRWKPPVLKRSVTAPIPPMSFSTFWPVNVNPLHRQHHDAGTLRRTPIADCVV
jgi:hypothetical protein